VRETLPLHISDEELALLRRSAEILRESAGRLGSEKGLPFTIAVCSRNVYSMIM